MSVAWCRLASRLRMARERLGPLVIIAAVLPLCGCTGEPSHGDRVPLVGTVTKGGKPLDVNATISFDPVGGQGGIGSMGGVAEGKFSIPEESGPTPGRTYKVTVRTAPGIPAEGTPRSQIRISQTFEKTVEIPPRGEEILELEIAFD